MSNHFKSGAKACFVLFSFSLVIIVPSILSCNKEATCDCIMDSVKVARVFQPDGVLGKDAIVESITPDTNMGTTGLFGTFSWTSGGLFNHSRGLIAFDLTSINPGTPIKKAVLSLYWITYGNLTEQTGENTFSIYRISQNWNESSVTWNNQPEISKTDSIVVPKSTSVNQDYYVDVTSYAQNMINNPALNYGFLLKLKEEMPYRLVIMASSDYVNESKRPKLTVYY
jgi:hypothetical protein